MLQKNKTENESLLNIEGNNSGVAVGTNYGVINNYYTQSYSKMPSLIANIVKAMADFDVGTMDAEMTVGATFKPDEKIDYNCVIKYKDIIKDYSTYFYQCEETINIFDDSNIGSKSKILSCVKMWYLKAKGELLKKTKDIFPSEIDAIKAYSDDLIDCVLNKISSVAIEYAGERTNLEEVELGALCFTCYCFMECKILEKPQ